jgi:hypothetical protein
MPPPEPPRGDIEIIADFAGLGVLSSITLLVVRDYDDPGTGTLLVIGGALGGGGIGWMISQKLEPSRAVGHATSAGLMLGVLNGALLLDPLEKTDSGAEVLPVLLLGATTGTVAGLALGHSLDLTEGQSLFATNLALLGFGTAALTGALLDDNGDGEVDPSAMISMTVGLDAGAVGGLLLAKKIKWSRGRARFVTAASVVGFFIGGMVGSLLATDKDPVTGESRTNADIAATGMLIGMWGGFGGGIALSADWAPDPRFSAPAQPTVTAAPMVGDQAYGLSVSGRF